MSAQLGSTRRRWPCFVPAAANSAVSSALSVISAGKGHVNPAVASRFNVNRTVDGATPTRRAISLRPTPAVLKRSTSRTWRIVVLSAGIRSPMQKAKGADPKSGQQRRRLTGRHHPGMPGEIISEHRARSNRNGGRHHRGFAGDFPRNPHNGGYIYSHLLFRPSLGQKADRMCKAELAGGWDERCHPLRNTAVQDYDHAPIRPAPAPASGI